MDKNEHVVLCIIGKTASGKDSLATALCERTGLIQLISHTTRTKRLNEGETHIFSTIEDYQNTYNAGEIAAYTEINGYKYWCTVNQLYTADVYVIDYLGLQTLRKLNLPNLRLVTVFINTPNEIRAERAIKIRKDDQTVFRKRELAEAAQFREMLREADFDYAIKNIEFAKAYSVLRWISSLESVWKNREVTE